MIRSHRSVLPLAATLASAALVALPQPASADIGQSATFAYTGSPQTFLVPDAVHSVLITAEGGTGAPGNYANAVPGGVGGLASGRFAVSPGDQLSVIVAGDAGSAGNYCGGVFENSCGGYGAGWGGSSGASGGGGASAVRNTAGTYLVVAAGGGGAGTAPFPCNGSQVVSGAGGAAGRDGAPGGGCAFNGLSIPGGGGGGAGTDTGPGAGGSGAQASCGLNQGPNDGVPGGGPDGGGGSDDAWLDMGAGGGGWWGGGSGGGGILCRDVSTTRDYGSASGGGGGGSSHVDAAAGSSASIGLPTSPHAFGINGHVTIFWDTVAPTATITANPGSPTGSNGWYTAPVGLIITGTDNPGGFGVTQTRCALDPATAPADFDALPPTVCQINSITTDGRHTLYAASVDAAGNKGPLTTATVNLDATAPTLAPTVTPNPVLLHGTATATANASDATSQLATSSCNPVSTTTAGRQSITCTAKDNAGISATSSASYTVQYAFSGYQAPVNNTPTLNTGKAGRSYPIKWQLTDAAGSYQSALTAVSSVKYQPTSCIAFASDPTDPLETTATGASALRYDSSTNQYVYTWATPAAGCYTLFLTLDSGQTFPAYFKLS